MLVMATYITRLFAQQVLTPDQAVKLALQNNYAIEIAGSELGIAKNNNSAGNAGFYPKVSTTASNNWSDANISQTISGTAIWSD